MAVARNILTGWHISMNNQQIEMETNDRPRTNPTSVTRQMAVSRNDLPLHCPTREMSLWNAHPRVFLPIEETGHARCPYCGTEFTLQP
jgi:uncharacterized Zn-finger protein